MVIINELLLEVSPAISYNIPSCYVPTSMGEYPCYIYIPEQKCFYKYWIDLSKRNGNKTIPIYIPQHLNDPLPF